MLLAELHVTAAGGLKHLGYLEIRNVGHGSDTDNDEANYEVTLTRLKAEATPEGVTVVQDQERTRLTDFPRAAGPWALVSWALSELESGGQL